MNGWKAYSALNAELPIGVTSQEVTAMSTRSGGYHVISGNRLLMSIQRNPTLVLENSLGAKLAAIGENALMANGSLTAEITLAAMENPSQEML